MNIPTASEKVNLLLSRGVKGVEIARACGVTQPTISRIATGKHVEPKEKTVRAIDRLFNEIYPDDGLPEHLRGKSKGEAA